MSDRPNDCGLYARHLIRGCEQSVRRLRTDHIDLYQMHHIDRSVPWEEIWQAMSVLIQSGKVLDVGASNFACWHLATAQAEARRLGLLGIVSEQCLYNLFVRYVELEVVPAAIYHGIGILPWSPLQGGALAGLLRKRAVAEAVRELRSELPSRLVERIMSRAMDCREKLKW